MKPYSAEIPRSTVEEHITEISGKEGFSIREKEQEIVNEILDTMPEKMTSRALTHWCKKNVDTVLEKHPEIKEEADIIRHKVRQEMLFEIRREDFEKLKEAIETESSNEFSPKWIKDNFLALANYIERKFKNFDGGVDWEFILGKLDIKKKNFNYQEHIYQSEEEVLSALEDLLEKENPQVFNQNWIFRYDRKLYSNIYRRLKKFDIGSWKPFIAKLGLQWLGKWIEGKENRVYNQKSEENIPKKMYEDNRAVDNILKKHAEDLYLFIEASKKEEFKKRNDVCVELIKEAQGGNLAAEKFLAENLEITVTNWIEKHEYFEIYKYYADEIKDRIKKCIYYYKSDSPECFFVSYLYTSLAKMAKRLHKEQEKEFDAPYYSYDKGGYQTHDRLAG